MKKHTQGGAAARWRRMVASAAVTGAVVMVIATPADAAPPPQKTITHVDTTFTCLDVEVGIIGGGTVTALLKHTSMPPRDGELTRTHVTGKYRFVADSGARRSYRVDYVRTYSEARGSVWEGWFLIDDVSTQNYWYADPGVVEFGDGGYAFGGPPWRSVCDELGYPTNEG
jgi:hypothetical protein